MDITTYYVLINIVIVFMLIIKLFSVDKGEYQGTTPTVHVQYTITMLDM